MSTTVEGLAAETLLEETKNVRVKGRAYDVPAPTLGTLWMVSGVVSRMTTVGSRDDITRSALARSGDAPLVAEALATIILGAKRIRGGVIPRLGRWRLRRLTMDVLESYSPEEALRTLIGLLNGLQLGVFFELTTFLSETNVLGETTREVVQESETGATARGLSSQGA